MPQPLDGLGLREGNARFVFALARSYILVCIHCEPKNAVKRQHFSLDVTQDAMVIAVITVITVIKKEGFIHHTTMLLASSTRFKLKP